MGLISRLQTQLVRKRCLLMHGIHGLYTSVLAYIGTTRYVSLFVWTYIAIAFFFFLNTVAVAHESVVCVFFATSEPNDMEFESSVPF